VLLARDARVRAHPPRRRAGSPRPRGRIRSGRRPLALADRASQAWRRGPRHAARRARRRLRGGAHLRALPGGSRRARARSRARDRSAAAARRSAPRPWTLRRPARVRPRPGRVARRGARVGLESLRIAPRASPRRAGRRAARVGPSSRGDDGPPPAGAHALPARVLHLAGAPRDLPRAAAPLAPPLTARAGASCLILHSVARVLPDTSPLRASREYRLLWSGQLVSQAGSALRLVAVPYQIYLLTGSSLAVGLIGLFSAGPLIAFSLFGGVIT